MFLYGFARQRNQDRRVSGMWLDFTLALRIDTVIGLFDFHVPMQEPCAHMSRKVELMDG